MRLYINVVRLRFIESGFRGKSDSINGNKEKEAEEYDGEYTMVTGTVEEQKFQESYPDSVDTKCLSYSGIYRFFLRNFENYPLFDIICGVSCDLVD